MRPRLCPSTDSVVLCVLCIPVVYPAAQGWLRAPTSETACSGFKYNKAGLRGRWLSCGLSCLTQPQPCSPVSEDLGVWLPAPLWTLFCLPSILTTLTFFQILLDNHIWFPQVVFVLGLCLQHNTGIYENNGHTNTTCPTYDLPCPLINIPSVFTHPPFYSPDR